MPRQSVRTPRGRAEGAPPPWPPIHLRRLARDRQARPPSSGRLRTKSHDPFDPRPVVRRSDRRSSPARPPRRSRARTAAPAPSSARRSRAVDLNGDGYTDLAIGAYGVSSSTGRLWTYLGGPSGIGIGPSVFVTGPDGNSAQFGYAVANAGDVDGDG
jgi:hypothetical protein